MSTVISYSVGEGDMFSIRHNSNNFTIIDCYLHGDSKGWILDTLKKQALEKNIRRFISTHPDMDHLSGLSELNSQLPLINFYCVENQAIKSEFLSESHKIDFLEYCSLRDGESAFYIEKNCSRYWMDRSDDESLSAGIEIQWPDPDNADYQLAMEQANSGQSFNNISTIVRYHEGNEASFLWMGDLETKFLEKIEDHVAWKETDILFAPHHGRDSGTIPSSILRKINPRIIIVGEAPSGFLNYYRDYNTITQNSAGDIIFECRAGDVEIYASNDSYEANFLTKEQGKGKYYIGTLKELNFGEKMQRQLDSLLDSTLFPIKVNE